MSQAGGQAGAATEPAPLTDLVIEHCVQIDSTNAELLRRESLPAVPLWLVAERQTQGRGRRARPWHSDVGASMTASLALERIRPRHLGALALVAGVAVADALTTLGVTVLLKWPNDVYVPIMGPKADGQPAFGKAGGILCEARARGDLTRLVIGVGLNLRAPPQEGIGQPVSGLFRDNAAPPMPAVAERVGRHLAAAVIQLLDEGFDAFAPRWQARDLLRDRPIVVHPVAEAAAWTGIACGIDGDGALRVMPEGGGQAVRLLAGEVSIRLQAAS